MDSKLQRTGAGTHLMGIFYPFSWDLILPLLPWVQLVNWSLNFYPPWAGCKELSYLLPDRLCSDQLTALECNWEKEGRRQEEIAEHKLNKQINSVAYYNQTKTEHDLFLLLAFMCCEGILIFFFFWPYSIICVV